MSTSEQPARIYVINLDEDRERLGHLDAQLSKLGLTYERFPALRGGELPEWLKAQFFDENDRPNGDLGLGEIGCYASHLNICRKIADEGIAKPVLILEDNADIGAGLPGILANLHRLPPDWNIVRCSNPTRSPYVSVAEVVDGVDAVRYWHIPAGTTAYLIRRRGAERFLAAWTTRIRAVDHDLLRFWDLDLNTYGLLPPPISRRSVCSRISQMDSRKKKTGSRGLREKAARLAGGFRVHGLYFGSRCVLAKLTSSLLKRIGTEAVAARALRVEVRSHRHR